MTTTPPMRSRPMKPYVVPPTTPTAAASGSGPLSSLRLSKLFAVLLLLKLAGSADASSCSRSSPLS
jgi:hypothetical protein